MQATRWHVSAPAGSKLSWQVGSRSTARPCSPRPPPRDSRFVSSRRRALQTAAAGFCRTLPLKGPSAPKSTVKWPSSPPAHAWLYGSRKETQALCRRRALHLHMSRRRALHLYLSLSLSARYMVGTPASASASLAGACFCSLCSHGPGAGIDDLRKLGCCTICSATTPCTSMLKNLHFAR